MYLIANLLWTKPNNYTPLRSPPTSLHRQELQYGYDAEDPRRGQQAGARPTAPKRHSRIGSIDYNSNGHDVNGHPNEATVSKGILRASSELPATRQNRDQDRKARTPDLSNESKEDKKKRGKSPFKY